MDDLLIFSEDEEGTEENNRDENPWIVLIVDDEIEIHKMTVGVLRDFSFEGRYLKFLNAYSSQEAKDILKNDTHIALILLDVVMEKDNSGLELVKYIREELGNSFVRIVLRTGQPGLAPEKDVIVEYDINDYKSKTELTVQKLYTTIVSSLRSYQGLRVIEKSRIGLEKIIHSTAKLYEIQSFQNFTNGVLIQLLSLLNLDESAFYCYSSGFTASTEGDDFIIKAASGKYEKWIDRPLKDILDEKLNSRIASAEKSDSGLFDNSVYVEQFCTKGGCKHLLYMERNKTLSKAEQNLVRIFSKNITIAYENIYDRMAVEKGEQEIVSKLGQVIIERSIGLGNNHIVRMAKFSFLLAKYVGLGEAEAKLLEKSIPLYDIGMINVSDSICSKPERLSQEEYDRLKNHTQIGYNILKGSKHSILQTASILALQHQEKWNGSGYPNGLKGEDIHMYGRISCLVSVFDALIHERLYKDVLSVDEAVDLITKERGEHFDPRLVDIFLENLDQFIAINERYPDAPKKLYAHS